MNKVLTHSSQQNRFDRYRATLLALTVHVLLLAFLWLGVDWQSQTPTTVEAEIWDAHPQQPSPQTVRLPAAVATPVTPRSIALPTEPKEAIKKPDIVVAQEKKTLLKPTLSTPPSSVHPITPPKKEKKIPDKNQANEIKDQKLREKLHEEEMRRITDAAGTNGKEPMNQANRSTGTPQANDSYKQKIALKIKNNAIFTPAKELIGNPSVEYLIELLPDGSLRNTPKKIKSSGVAGFDEVIERAIEKSQPFPADQSGRVPSSITISHKPKDE